MFLEDGWVLGEDKEREEMEGEEEERRSRVYKYYRRCNTRGLLQERWGKEGSEGLVENRANRIDARHREILVEVDDGSTKVVGRGDARPEDNSVDGQAQHSKFDTQCLHADGRLQLDMGVKSEV